MTAMYQPPLSPTGSSAFGSNYAPTKSPFFTASNQFLPRNLHDVIRWARFITVQSPVVTEVIRKLATYPITDFVVGTKNSGVKDKYTELIRSLNLKSTLHNIGFEYHTVGNVFVSVYFPIQRSLICPKCKASHNALNATFTKFTAWEFRGKCPSCSSEATFAVKDSKSLDMKRMNVVTWDPLNISVNHNPITNESEFYYKIPNDIRNRVRQGDKLLVNSIPWEMVDAIRNNQDFKFEKHAVFHLKNISAGHLLSGVAVPPLISQFTTVYYQATLRKANEAIATDFMTPLRVIYPQAATANSDPVVAISLRNFAANMNQAVRQHKQDNSHVLIAPVPIGYETISGEGKTLLVSQEIKQAEESLLLSMGVSLELLSGTTNWTSSTVGLRMMENTLQCYVDQIEHLISWIFEQASKYLGLEVCKVSLTPFRLMDDDNLRQTLLALVASGKASMTSLFEACNLDYEEEIDRMKEDAVRLATSQVEIQLEVERAQFLAARASTSQQNEGDEEYKNALTQAQEMAEQLSQVDETTCRKTLNEIKVTDYALWLMTSKLLQEQRQAMREQANGMAAGDPNAAGGPQSAGQPGQPGQPTASTGAAPGSTPTPNPGIPQ